MRQRILNVLMREYTREQPDEFQKVSLDQIYAADKVIFLALAERTEGGLDALPGGAYPLDSLIQPVLDEPRIKSLLNPFPKSVKGQTVKTTEIRGTGTPASLAP